MIDLNTFQAIADGFDFRYLLSILLSVIPALICLTVHELSHGLLAFYLGDDTAKRMGRLSLNPFKHLDPLGTLMLLVFHVGWAKPVMVDMQRFSNPKRGMALTALAGPLSNILLALLFLFLYGFLHYPCSQSIAGGYVLEMLAITSYMSIGLAVFNLIPVAPLDGSKVLFAVVPDAYYEKMMRYERYGALLVMVLVASGILGRPLSELIETIYLAVFPIAQWADRIMINQFIL